MESDAPHWDYWRSFLAVLNEGTLSGAALSLGLTQPTVGRHIEMLESVLAVPLFVRSVRGLSPTDTTLALRPHAEAMGAAAEALVRTASGSADQLSGTIRLTASEFVGAHVLPEVLASFGELHRRIDIELVLSDRTDDLSGREADIAVRMLAPTQAALVAKKLGTVRIALYAHRRYVERHGTPKSLEEDVSGHRFIGFDRDTRSLDALRAQRSSLTRDVFALRADRDAAQMALLRAGAGIGGCQVQTARRIPELVPVLHDEFGFDLEMWLVMHEDLRRVARMRALFDHLDQQLKAYVSI